MNFGLEGKSVLVLASSGGIGLAIAKGFAAEGAALTICGRSAAALEAAAGQLPEALAIRGDVTVPSDLTRIVDAAIAQFGGIDILVINAGGPPPGAFETLDDQAWSDALDLVLMSAIRAARLVLPGMRARRWGRIVVVSSYGVKQPIPALTLSNSVRMAVLGWAKTLSLQVAGDNILVNTICPGWTRTDRVAKLVGDSDEPDMPARIAAEIPLGRMAEPEEIAGLAVFLGSEAASYITGAAIQVDGGIVKGYA